MSIHLHPGRLRRLSHGWEPAQLAARMKLQAARDGITLPRAYLVVRWLFLWENHRASLPDTWAPIIARVLDTPPAGAGGRTRGR